MLFSRQKKVVVITPTVGHRLLPQALRSVQTQTYRHVEHLVVVDGPESESKVRTAVQSLPSAGRQPILMVLPRRTGMNGWNGHRIYAAVPFLVEADFICYLDQDNWFDKEHVETLIEVTLRKGSSATFALRKIYSQSGDFVCTDDCESLGPLHDCYEREGRRHIDTNCWIVSRDLAMSLANDWLVPHSGDRLFAAGVMKRHPDLPCTQKYSVNYTAESTRASVTIDYFLRGNEIMRQRYPTGLPWRA